MALSDACEVCLQTNNESVLPRTEITEQCVLCLLNLGRWEFLINFDKRWPSFEITAAIALACQELVKQKGNKKLSKNLWEIGTEILCYFLFYSFVFQCCQSSVIRHNSQNEAIPEVQYFTMLMHKLII